MILLEQTHVFYNRQEPIEPTPIILGVATPITVRTLLTVQLQFTLCSNKLIGYLKKDSLFIILSVKTSIILVYFSLF